MLRHLVVGLAALVALSAGTICAQASVVITVNKTTQRLSVSINGEPRYQWPVSTARWGYSTPNGTYRPERLERTWYSRKYDMSPMPYSIFFDGGYAIHGSYEISHIGRPASHGCIRLNPRNAAVLFSLVSAHPDDTRIVVSGVGASEWRGEARERPRYERVRETSRRERRLARVRGEHRLAHVHSRRSDDDTFESGFNDAPDYDASPQYDPPREERPW
jgi:hypothetical protein